MSNWQADREPQPKGGLFEHAGAGKGRRWSGADDPDDQDPITAITAPMARAPGEMLSVTRLSFCSGDISGILASSFCISAASYPCWEMATATVANAVPPAIRRACKLRPALPRESKQVVHTSPGGL